MSADGEAWEYWRNRAIAAEITMRAVRDDVCGILCPSQWKTADGPPPHHPKCIALRAALTQETEAAEEIERVPVRLEWRPIETAPRDGQEILISTQYGVRVGFWDEARGGVWSIWQGGERAEPPYWKPIDAPPDYPVAVTTGDHRDGSA